MASALVITPNPVVLCTSSPIPSQISCSTIPDFCCSNGECCAGGCCPSGAKCVNIGHVNEGCCPETATACHDILPTYVRKRLSHSVLFGVLMILLVLYQWMLYFARRRHLWPCRRQQLDMPPWQSVRAVFRRLQRFPHSMSDEYEDSGNALSCSGNWAAGFTGDFNFRNSLNLDHIPGICDAKCCS